MNPTIETEPKSTLSRRAFIGLGKIGVVALVATHPKGSFEVVRTVATTIFDLAKNHDQEAAYLAPQVPISPVAMPVAGQPSEVVVASAEVVASNTETLGDGWYLEPGYQDIIGLLDIEQYKKDFVIFAIENMALVIREGALINPRIGIAQTVLETGYGKHLAAKNNYFGQKAYKNEPYNLTGTLEDHGNGLVSEEHKFKEFEAPIDSFRQYGRKIDELKHFDDAEACRYSDETYIVGVQNYADPATCNIILPQGTRDEKGNLLVSSYATSTDYTTSILNVSSFLDLDRIFTRRD